MKLRLLAALPFVWAAALYAGVQLTVGSTAQVHVMRAEIELAKLLALVGCTVAALAFERGDYLRRAWYLSGSCYLFLLIRDVGLGAWTPWAPGPRLFGLPTEVFESVLVFIANIGAVWGVVMLARAWTVAGLGESDSHRNTRLLFVLALVIAVVVVGSNLHIDVVALAHGNLASLVMIASDVGDIISLALIAPVLLTALALRGGSLLWPWALLTASMFGWLFYDATTSVGHVVRGSVGLKLTGELFRSFACTFAFSAGIAQRIAIGKRE